MVFQKRTMSFIGGGLLGVACILYIVANALPMWSKLYFDSNAIANIAKLMKDLGLEISDLDAQTLANIKSLTGTFGLWQLCVSTDLLSRCGPLYSGMFASDINAQMLTARAFITIACILSGFASGCIVACVFMHEDSNRILVRLAKFLPYATLVAGIIGVAVGISFTVSSNLMKIHVASILGIIALVFNLAGAVVALLIK